MKITRFENAERFRGVNRTLQVIFFATACFMAFFLALKRLPVIDITKEGRYSLTPETISYLRTLSENVDIVGSLSLGESSSLGGDRLREIQNLTNRYAEVSPKVQVKWVDAFKAQAEYGFKNPYRILIRNADRSVWVAPEELYSSQEDVFLGERALTSALWRLANPEKKNVLVVVSKDRWEADGPWGFKRLGEFFQGRNIQARQVSPSDLTKSNLSGLDVIFVLGDSEKMTAAPLASLQRVVNDHRAGVLLAIDEPPSDALKRFLYFNGIDWPGIRVDETDSRQKTPLGETLIRDFQDHPITQTLRQNELTVLSRGNWWALKPREALVDVSAWPIFESSLQSVAAGGQQKGPFILMAALERKSSDEAPARLLVCGSSDYMANAYLTYHGNQTLLESSLDWLMGNRNLLSIPPRARQVRQLGITSSQLWRMGGGMLGCALVLFGIGVVRWITKPR